MINGRRIAPYGSVADSTSVDVNNIPIAAIERVEVLKEGASAVYGSDAIAGVINFILRREYTGAGISAEYGQTASGGGTVTTASDRHLRLRQSRQGQIQHQRSRDLPEERSDLRRRSRLRQVGHQRVRPHPASDVNTDTTSGNTSPAEHRLYQSGAHDRQSAARQLRTDQRHQSVFQSDRVPL